MSMLNTRIELIEKAEIWNADPHHDWNVDVMTAKSFVDITARGLGRQFKDAIMKPYEDMLEREQVTPNPTSKPTQKPTRKPTAKPTRKARWTLVRNLQPTTK